MTLFFSIFGTADRSSKAGVFGRCLCAFAVLAASVHHARAEPPGRLTHQQLETRLGMPAAGSWTGVELRDALGALAESQQVPILLDRRVDPTQQLKLVVGGTLRDLLIRIADNVHGGISVVDCVVYLGPAQSARDVRTLAALRRAEIARLTPARQAPLLAARPMSWSKLTTPRELIEKLAGEARVALKGLDRVPHDLWPAASLPALAWSDRLTLIACQFDLTFRLNGGNDVELVPIEGDVSVVRRYNVGKKAPEVVKRWSREMPSARFEFAADTVVATALVEDHERIAAILAGSRPANKPATTADRRYQLSVQNVPLEKLLEYLERTLGVEIKVETAQLERAGLRLDALVSVQVKDATLEELLAATLKPAGLEYRRSGSTVTIFPAASAR